MPAAKKDSSVRARRNVASTRSTLGPVRGKPRIPPLPVLAYDDDWHPAVVAWWNDVWSSPMSAEFLAVDLRALEILVVLENDFWTAGTAKERQAAATEIRLQRKDFGLTPYDRRRLEWTIEEADAAQDRGRQRRARQGVKQASGAADPRRALHSVPAV